MNPEAWRKQRRSEEVWRWVLAIIIATLLIFAIVIANGQEITAEDIRKTEEHRNQLVQALEGELDQVKDSQRFVAEALAKASSRNFDLQVEINEVTANLNRTQGNLDAALKKLWWWRLHAWATVAIAAAGLILCGFIGFLKFSGRLAIVGAKVGI